MQLQSSYRQSPTVRPSRDSDEQSFECNQTLTDPASNGCQMRVKQCGCRCKCQLEEGSDDPAQKRRQKRKQSKRRQKEKYRQQREKAMRQLERIIRDIYALRVGFLKVKDDVKYCLGQQSSREKICAFINVVIRDEVEMIRKEVAQIVKQHENAELDNEEEAIRAVFAPIQRISQASAEIQKLINLFVSQFSEQEETPLQRNFGRTTLKFLVRADLYKSGIFSRICAYIFQAPPQRFPQERELINYMMAAFDSEEEGSLSQSSDTEEGVSQCMEDQDDWEEDVSTIDSTKQSFNQKEQMVDRGRRRKERRRRRKEEVDNDFQAVLKRTQQMKIEQRRSACHVDEDCIARILGRKWKYTLQGESKGNQ